MTSASRFRADGSILLISCYEMGHQPLGLAGPAGALRRAGYAPSLVDLSQESLDLDAASRAAFVGICVPMHTALVMGARIAQRIRDAGGAPHIGFFGLYAGLNAGHLLGRLADSVVTGDPDTVLPHWIAALEEAQYGGSARILPGVSTRSWAVPAPLARPSNLPPDRTGLPPLEAYVRLECGGETVLAGYVESTRGCKHLCLHCPIPPVFGGRFFAVPRDAVLADIRQQVHMGARHITFGDPDFLNGPGHALALVRALHAEWPELGYDFTAKVEHLLRHADLLPAFAATGCRFIVSAVESLSDTVLRHLDKGHTREDVRAALALAQSVGIPIRPSLMPFTPWSTLADYLELLDWIEREHLIRHVEPIQLAIRLLVPPGSSLLGTAQFEPHRRALHAEGFTWTWTHPDPAMDALQKEVLSIVDRAAARADAAEATFFAIRTAARRAAGLGSQAMDEMLVPTPPVLPVPRLTEPWFC